MVGATGSSGAWTAVLGEPSVQDVLAQGRIVRAIHGVGEVGSTQDVALELARAGLDTGTVVIADVQRSGRGRVGRRWEDAPDGGTLALTLLLEAGMDAVALVPHALGLAVAEACELAVPAAAAPSLRLKWPNDVVTRTAPDGPRRKLAGVLVERERTPAGDLLLCGIGIDVDLRGHPEVAGRTCLAARIGEVPDRPALLGVLLAKLDEYVGLVVDDPEGLIARYRVVSDTIGRDVVVRGPGGRDMTGTAIDVDAGGRLLLRTDDGVHVVLSGTVRDVGEDEPEVEGVPSVAPDDRSRR